MSDRTEAPSWATSEPTLTEPQKNYIEGLLAERELEHLTEEQQQFIQTMDVTKLSKGQASRVITALKDLPKKIRTKAEVGLPDIPAGRYAVENEDGELRFYVLDRPTEGKWAGRMFLSVMASSEKHPIKSFEAKKSIMEKIVAAGPQEAMNRFGEEIGRCGRCYRVLTNTDSRARGIGPVCAGIMRADFGWWS